jgi:ABC-type nitrate/sulfonate/bicarbonate transport system substrate-binding protein
MLPRPTRCCTGTRASTERDGKKIPRVDDFLSNIAEDVTETTNAAKEHPDVVARLTKLHQEWAREVKQE